MGASARKQSGNKNPVAQFRPIHPNNTEEEETGGDISGWTDGDIGHELGGARHLLDDEDSCRDKWGK